MYILLIIVIIIGLGIISKSIVKKNNVSIQEDIPIIIPEVQKKLKKTIKKKNSTKNKSKKKVSKIASKGPIKRKK